jgi:hypothetical protein
VASVTEKRHGFCEVQIQSLLVFTNIPTNALIVGIKLILKGVTLLKMEPTLVTETSEVKTQKPGKFPEESTLESQRGENLKT